MLIPRTLWVCGGCVCTRVQGPVILEEIYTDINRTWGVVNSSHMILHLEEHRRVSRCFRNRSAHRSRPPLGRTLPLTSTTSSKPHQAHSHSPALDLPARHHIQMLPYLPLKPVFPLVLHFVVNNSASWTTPLSLLHLSPFLTLLISLESTAMGSFSSSQWMTRAAFCLVSLSCLNPTLAAHPNNSFTSL